ncbi:MAG: DUF2811 domain-containing protein [Microcystaceae cyanobacterium]
MKTSVSILADIPEELHDSLTKYLEEHPKWDLERVFAVALSSFLLQNEDAPSFPSSDHYRSCARVYLETLFHESDPLV